MEAYFQLRRYYTLHKIVNDYRPPAVTVKSLEFLDVANQWIDNAVITVDRRLKQTVLGYGPVDQSGSTFLLMLDEN